MTPGQTKLREWRECHPKAARELFGVEPDIWQDEFLGACSSNERNPQFKRVGAKACTGPGKSAAEAWEGWIRLACYGERGEHPKGAALSGEGWDNLQDNLWAELAKWQSRSAFLKDVFKWNKERIFCRDHEETWFLSARSYPKNADGEAIGRSLSGLHSRYPFVLLDETGQMPVTVGQKAEQIFTGGCRDGLIAAMGNPVTQDGLLYSIAKDERYFVITITADPDDPRRTPRVDIELAREQIERWGRDNPWVMATILGEFPASGFNVLLTVEQVEAAMGRHLRPEQYQFSQKRLGIDIADAGDDRTAIFPRQGLASFMPVEMRTQRGPDIAARVITGKLKWDSEIEFFDDTGGWGGSFEDAMLQAGYTPMPVNFSGKAIDPRYYNKRAEIWFEMAEWVKRGGALPNKRELIGELTTPTYTIKNGKFILEPKEKIKERLKRSPDLAEALAVTFALPEMPGRLHPAQRRGELKHEYDPYAPTSEMKSDYDPYSPGGI